MLRLAAASFLLFAGACTTSFPIELLDGATTDCTGLADGTSCGAGTCWEGSCCTGCWDGVACIDEPRDSACGRGGAECALCTEPLPSCVEGLCAPRRRIIATDTNSEQSCAIDDEGGLWCWGGDAFGTLWDGGSRSSPQPIAAVPGSTLLGIGGGYGMHGCVAADDGPLACFGNNNDGQTGHGEGESFSSPTVLESVRDLRFSRVSPARASTVALTTDGRALVWGWNGSNRLGLGSSVGNAFEPEELLPGRSVIDIAMTGFHGCLVEEGGDLSCWGSAGPQLGADISGETPMLVGSSYSRVFAGIGHTCGLRGEDLYCWGDSEFGEVGDGTIGSVDRPTRVEPPGVWASASLGEHHTCAIRTDGSLWCWGRNEDGEAGLGDVVSTPTPMEVQIPDDVAPGAGWTAVSASVTHTCAIRENRALYCWGANSSSQVSGGERPTRTPIPVIFPME